MPVTPSVDGDNNKAAVKGPAPTKRPPLEEKNWKYYSRHHELPLSSISSITIHVLGIALLVVGGLLAARFGSSNDPLALDVATDPGGGGNPEGDPNSAAPATSRAETASDVKESASSVKPKPEEEHATPKAESQPLPVPESDNGRRIAEESQKASAQAGKAASEVEKALQQAGSGGPPSKGKGGTGSGGGSGSGVGPGEGSGHDAGIMTKRAERRRRWQLNFRVSGPVDHLNQFAALGAILAIPEPGGGYRIFKELRARHPRGTHVDDLSGIDRIGFADQEPQTAAGLARELGMPPTPFLLAFFPQKLEKKMLDMELQYRGTPEEDIREKMYFQVVPTGTGYDVVVDSEHMR
jgi:hypothetical protein